MANAPVRILGWDDSNQHWAAAREGERSFAGVQDLGDAFMACHNRSADLIVSDHVYAEMVARGDAWLPRPDWVRFAATRN